MWLICGLGNPGNKFKNTRHNIGFDLVDSIIEKYNFELKKKDRSKELFKGKINDNIFLFCKSMDFMNQSGKVISEITKFYKIPKNKILIIHDDLDLIVGKVKIKIGGGNGGHNGLASIDNLIGTNYKRLRIGIGHPGSKELVSSYVLEQFNKEDKKRISNIIKFLAESFELIFNEDNIILTKLANKIQ